MMEKIRRFEERAENARKEGNFNLYMRLQGAVNHMKHDMKERNQND